MSQVTIDCGRRGGTVDMIVRKFPQIKTDILELGEWLRDHLEIKDRVCIQLYTGKVNGRTRGDAPWPHMCNRGESIVNIHLNSIFGCHVHTMTTVDMECSGRYRTMLKVLCHEMVHVQQYGLGTFGTRLISRKRHIVWQGEVWVGPRGKTYNSYKNLPWEVEAFDREWRLLDGWLKRRHLLRQNKIRLCVALNGRV